MGCVVLSSILAVILATLDCPSLWWDSVLGLGPEGPLKRLFDGRTALALLSAQLEVLEACVAGFPGLGHYNLGHGYLVFLCRLPLFTAEDFFGQICFGTNQARVS